MGREIRRVPKGWEHPRRQCPHSPWNGGCEESKRSGGFCYQPLFDRDFETEAVEWLAENAKWEDGTDPDRAKWEAKEGQRKFYWEWSSVPPDREYYRPKWTDEERTCIQMYETVSEGTPVSPVFETADELIEYLVHHGSYWDQYGGGEGGWPRENAEKFVKTGYAPSMIIEYSNAGVNIKGPRDGA